MCTCGASPRAALYTRCEKLLERNRSFGGAPQDCGDGPLFDKLAPFTQGASHTISYDVADPLALYADGGRIHIAIYYNQHKIAPHSCATFPISLWKYLSFSPCRGRTVVLPTENSPTNPPLIIDSREKLVHFHKNQSWLPNHLREREMCAMYMGKTKRVRKKRHNKTSKQQPLFRALTYNMSFATQLNQQIGSEEDFVKKCQATKRDCYKHALDHIGRLHRRANIDTIGIQEVQDTSMREKVQKQCPHLDCYYRPKVMNKNIKKDVHALLLWDSRRFGKAVKKVTINLASEDSGDGRPCGIVKTSKDFILIVAHFPWVEDAGAIKSIQTKLKPFVDETSKIIIMADTNDAKTLISKSSPFILGNHRLSQGMTQKELRSKLKSCCWHAQPHPKGWGHYTDTGDYILTNGTVKKQVIPKVYKDDYTKRLYSDHKPVVGEVVF